MIRAYGLAFAQLLDPRILRWAMLSVLITLAVYGLLIGGIVLVLSYVELATIPWLDMLARWGSGLAAVLLATLMFPGVVSAVIMLGQERIIDAVEGRHYPGLPPARPLALGAAIGVALRLLGLTVLLNLLMLPVYMALLLLPPLNVLVFAVVNGALLGRDYFQTVALRRLSPTQVSALRLPRRKQVWAAGTVAALLLTIPGLNLIAPVIATAAFVHLVQEPG
jgi:uncharacterized protein involved in cysteine biosynthesis